MVYIETPRLLLRDWKEEDFVPFAEMNRNPSVMEFFLHPLSEDSPAAFLILSEMSSTDAGMGDMPSSGSRMGLLSVLRASITLRLMWISLRALRYCGDWGGNIGDRAMPLKRRRHVWLMPKRTFRFLRFGLSLRCPISVRKG